MRHRLEAVAAVLTEGLLIGVLWVATFSAACAQTQSSPHGGHYGLDADLEGAYRPIAVDLSSEAWYRYIYRNDASRLWDGLYIKGGGALDINPAYGRVGAYVEWMPVAILILRAEFDRYAFFGTNGSLLIYTDSSAPFGVADYKARRGQEVAAGADRIMLQPTLQVEIGSWMLVNQASFARYDFQHSGPYFWEQEYDTLLARHDRLFADDLSLLYDFAREAKAEHLLVGPSLEVVHASGANLTRTRAGLSLYFEPHARVHAADYQIRPRFYFQLGVNTQDRNQDGRLYVLGGIGMGVDFD